MPDNLPLFPDVALLHVYRTLVDLAIVRAAIDPVPDDAFPADFRPGAPILKRPNS